MTKKTSNGYIIEQYNERGYILTRTGATGSNYFIIVDHKPIFESLLYVNNFTRKFINGFIKREGL